MQAGVSAFPALGASEYEQGFDFSLSTPQNLNTFLFPSGIPSWSVFNFQTKRNITFLRFIGNLVFFCIFIGSCLFGLIWLNSYSFGK